MATRPKILFVSIAHPGQYNPLLSIAATVEDQYPGRFDISFCSHPQAKKEITGLLPKARFVDFGVNYTTYERLADPVEYASFRGPPLGLTSGRFSQKLVIDPARYKQEVVNLREHLVNNRPDYMVIDVLTFSAVELARDMEIPYTLNIPCNPRPFVESSALNWNYPALGTGFPYRMTLWQKFLNLLYLIFLRVNLVMSFLGFLKIRKTLGLKTKFNIIKFGSDARKVLIDTVVGVEYPFKVLPNARTVGACVPPTPVQPCELLEWLDRHEKVVYIGFGTLTILDETLVRKWLEVCAAFPQVTFLFKLGRKGFHPPEQDIPSNVRTIDFLPSQLDVLGHQNVHIFVSHCGGNGFHEGIYFGKVMLGVPQWTDCYDFAQRLQDCGAGLRVMNTLPYIDTAEVKRKLKDLIENPVYKENVDRLQDLMKVAGGSVMAAKIIVDDLNSL